MKRKVWLAVIVMAAVVTNVNAGLVTLALSEVFEGTVDPSGPAPWITAVFDDEDSAGSVKLTISASLPDLDEKVGALYLNSDVNPDDLNFSDPIAESGSFGYPTVSQGLNAYKAGGDGYYDIMIDFITDDAQAFNNFDSVSYMITAPGITAASFNVLSNPGKGGNTEPFLAAAHIQGLGSSNAFSSWITVPEPATMALLTMGSVMCYITRK